VIVKSDGYPTFQFANVIDDHLMNISHVIRGNEHIQNTYMQILFYEIFGWEPPKFAHLSLLLESDRSKMSKRKGSVSVEAFQEEGYLPEALVNFVFLLGFAPSNDQELFSIEEMIHTFEVSRCNKSNSIFDREKLKWMNGQYISNLTNSKFLDYARDFSKDILPKFQSIFGDNFLENFRKGALLEKEKLRIFSELPESLAFYYNYLPPEEAVLCKRNDRETIKKVLKLSSEQLYGADFDKLYKEEEKNREYYALVSTENIPDEYCAELMEGADLSLEGALENVCELTGLKRGEVFWAIRVAITGKPASPGVFETMNALGRDVVFSRIEKVLNL
jgi:glutamyl-tRNA synthetase